MQGTAKIHAVQIITLVCVSIISAQLAATANAAILPQRFQDALVKLRMHTTGQLLIVDCQGQWGYDAIQSAIDDANDGDAVVVFPRNFAGLDCTGDAYLENITFKGKAITVQSVLPNEDKVVAATIIDGQLATAPRPIASTVRFTAGEQHDSKLIGFTIQGGSGSVFEEPILATPGYRNGGGILCKYASPTISRCVIANNSATDLGGGVCVYQGNPQFIDCTISHNSAGGAGGGSANVSHYQEELNEPLYLRCKIVHNTATGAAGVYNLKSASTFKWCDISHNAVSNELGNGGGFLSLISTCSLIHCTLSANKAEYGSAIYNDVLGDLELALKPTHTRLINCVVSGNRGFRSTIFAVEGGLHMMNCTVMGNWTFLPPAGVHANDESFISHSILYNNTWHIDDQDFAGQLLSDEGTKLEYSIVQNFDEYDGPSLGDGNSGADPGFVDPGTWVDLSTDFLLDIQWLAGDFHLASDAAAVDAGNLVLSGRVVRVDIDGEPRIQGERIDIGADEVRN